MYKHIEHLLSSTEQNHALHECVIKVNVAVYKDLNIEFVTKKRFCHENAV